MDIKSLIRESNAIEGIKRDPTQAEIDEFDRFINLESVLVHDLERFVAVYEPHAVLRRQVGMNVRVGGHVPPSGGPKIEEMLINLLLDIGAGLPAWQAHVRYETIHPFSDGNGRSGRMLWFWQMWPDLSLGFLHKFYYQTLNNAR